jgi:hypothetical protein
MKRVRHPTRDKQHHAQSTDRFNGGLEGLNSKVRLISPAGSALASPRR